MPTPREPEQSEAALVAEIRIALGQEPDVLLFRNAGGNALFEHGRRGRFGLAKGAADLVGIFTTAADVGVWLALEVKTPTGRLSPDQERWIALVRRRGGVAEVVRSVEDARAVVHQLRQRFGVAA